MELKAGHILYVRIDYKIDDQEETAQDGVAAMKYLESISEERYLVAGVFGDMDLGEMQGAMILFEAKNMEDAKALCDNDPLMKKGLYRYELYKWNMMIASR